MLDFLTPQRNISYLARCHPIPRHMNILTDHLALDQIDIPAYLAQGNVGGKWKLWWKSHSIFQVLWKTTEKNMGTSLLWPSKLETDMVWYVILSFSIVSQQSIINTWDLKIRNFQVSSAMHGKAQENLANITQHLSSCCLVSQHSGIVKKAPHLPELILNWLTVTTNSSIERNLAI